MRLDRILGRVSSRPVFFRRNAPVLMAVAVAFACQRQAGVVPPPVAEPSLLAATAATSVTADTPMLPVDAAAVVSAASLAASDSGPVMAIVIDDIGYHETRLDRLLKTGLPLTFAVIPGLPGSIRAAREIAEAGHMVLVHMPMEPQGYPKENPGPCALFLRMSFAERQQTLDRCAGSIPGAAGLNNHMGSKYSEDANAMTQVIDWLDARQMLFLDSRTTPRTVGALIWAQRHGNRLERTVFLDNDRKADLIGEQLKLTAKEARRRGAAIAIGHPYPQTISAITQAQASGLFQDVRVVSLDALARRLEASASLIAKQP